MRRRLVKYLAVVVAIALSISMVTGCSKKAEESGADSDNKEVSALTENDNKQVADETDPWKLARTTTYAPYPETVTFTMGITVRADVAYPEGSTDTVENSAYTRFLKSKLNIQNKSAFEAANDEDFKQKISLAITSGELPDIVTVGYDEFKELVRNDMIEDLTESYNNCASDLMKEIYASNDNRSLEMATIDGKLYALPVTAISSGPEMLWLRGDWMDKLGLSAPETLEDIANIVRAFIEKDPGGNGPGKTIGIPLCIAGDNFLYGGYSAAFRVNNIFTSFGAFPEQWIAGKDGLAVYGSVQPEMKQGLQVLADWYKEGIIDQQFAVRSYDDIKALVTDGKCGSYFCGWWAPYDLAASYELNPDVDWRAYILPAGPDGKVTMWAGNPNQYYTVVRKGFEYPELIIKAKSVTLDYNQGDAAYTDDSKECKEYLDWVSHSYGIEVIGGFDFYDAAERAYLHISEAINGTRDPKQMNAYEHSLYESCKKYLDAVNAGKKPEKTDWLNYNCRMVSSKLMYETEVNTVQPVFFSQTESMPLMWESLKKMERETILKIVTNEVGIDEFDTFVNEWMSAGGDIITKEVNEEIKK
jgi:putative aldouronate transport system substrate-binding protein